MLTTAADPALDMVTQLSMSAALAFHDHLSEDLLAALGAGYQRGASTEELLTTAQEILENYAPNLATLLSDARLASWISGAGRVADQVPVGVGIGGPPGAPPVASAAEGWSFDGMSIWRPLVEAAAQDLRSRQLLLKADYEAASKAVRDQSFTVAHQSSLDALEDIRQAVTGAVEEGTGWPEFRKTVEGALGVGAVGPKLLQNVFRTNVQTAYARGQDEIVQQPVMRGLLPYAERFPIDDSRLTEFCEALAVSGIGGGSIYRSDDPVWLRYRPPSHYQCRCGSRFLTIEQAAEKGIEEAQEWLRTGKAPRRPEFVPWPAVEHLRGFVKGWSGGGPT